MGQISKLLRERISAAQSVYEVAKQSGVDTAAIYRFANGDRDLRLNTVEKLCEYFGLELRPVRKSRK